MLCKIIDNCKSYLHTRHGRNAFIWIKYLVFGKTKFCNCKHDNVICVCMLDLTSTRFIFMSVLKLKKYFYSNNLNTLKLIYNKYILLNQFKV